MTSYSNEFDKPQKVHDPKNAQIGIGILVVAILALMWAIYDSHEKKVNGKGEPSPINEKSNSPLIDTEKNNVDFIKNKPTSSTPTEGTYSTPSTNQNKTNRITNKSKEENSNSSNDNTATNHSSMDKPSNTNEHNDIQKTVEKECETKNTGDYCFRNNSLQKLIVQISNHTALGMNNDYNASLEPGQSKCFYNLFTGAWGYFITTPLASQQERNSANYHAPGLYDNGQILIEKCRSDTFIIK